MKENTRMGEREKLFHKWKELPVEVLFTLETISQLKGIVQNPGTIPEETIQEWREHALKNWVKFKNVAEQFLIDYKNLTKEILDHLREKTYDVYIHPESDDVWYELADAYNKYAERIPTVEIVISDVSEEVAKLKVEEIRKSLNTNIKDIVQTIRTMRA